jgi:hypothetical protein
MFASWYKYKTHCHVTGAPQTGKSKFIELCIREKIKRGLGVTFVDWHGKTYNEIVEYLAYLRPKQPIYLFNLSESTHILPYDPFALPDGWDVSAHVSRLTDLIVKPWGAENTNQLPTYERIVKMVLTFCAVSGEPLHNGAKLLEYPKRELREHAIALTDGDVKQNWTQLQYLSLQKGKFEAYLRQVESTQNRLGRFIGSRAIKIFTGLGSQFSIERAIEENAIVLVNLKPSRNLSPESGKVFAALLLAGYLQAALDRAEKPKPHFMYLDECQNYLSTDAAKMLDQVPKSGLRLTLIHHHLGQFWDQIHLQQSIETDCRCKVTFAGLPIEAAKRAGEQSFLPELNRRWKKDDRWRTVTEWFEQPTETITETESEHGRSRSVAVGSRAQAYQRLERDGQEDWSREEKVSQVAARFLALKTGECYINLPDKTYRYEVPFVQTLSLRNRDKFLEFMQDLTKSYIPLHEAEIVLKEKERAFLERSNGFERGPGRPKKKPAYLHPQG